MTFQNFISCVDSTANLAVSVHGTRHGQTVVTTANNVSINGNKVMMYVPGLDRYVHTIVSEITKFEKV